MKLLSKIADRAVFLAKDTGISYSTAAVKALREVGYPNPNQTLRVTMHLEVDIKGLNFGDKTSLVSLVAMAMGQRGGTVAAHHGHKIRQEAPQLLLAGIL